MILLGLERCMWPLSQGFQTTALGTAVWQTYCKQFNTLIWSKSICLLGWSFVDLFAVHPKENTWWEWSEVRLNLHVGLVLFFGLNSCVLSSASNKGRMIRLSPQERLQDCVKSRSGRGHLRWHQSGPDKLVSIWCLGQRLGFQSAGFIEWREKKIITSWYKWVSLSLECLSVFTTCTVFVQYFHSVQDHYIRKLHSVW